MSDVTADKPINLRKLTDKQLDQRYKALIKLQKEDGTYERNYLIVQIGEEVQHRYLVTEFNREHGLQTPVFPPESEATDD